VERQFEGGLAMKINLVAVQAKPVLEDYRSARAFHAKMSDLMRRAVSQVDTSLPTLVAFPEGIGLFLSFVPFYYEQVKDCQTLAQVITRVVPRNLLPFLGTALRYRVFGLKTAFVHTALQAEKIYHDTFSNLAREYGVYLLAGSVYTPPIEYEVSRGRHIAAARVQNTAYLFSPKGLCLRRVPKLNFTRPLEARIGLWQGQRSDLVPADTALGRIGILVCLDGFFETLIEHYDGLGAQIIVKPSYNMAPWNAPWHFDRRLKEGEAWLRYGLPAIIQGRENILYGVNPMLVGKILDLEAEGLSSVSWNTGDPSTPGEKALLAVADRPDEEAIVAATVELPERRGAVVALQGP
jgi:predicted amidohydrolase